MAEPAKITSKKLIVAEGWHVVLFLRWACRKYGVENDVQVMEGGGVRELRRVLRLLKNVEGFDQLETLVVARDAEISAEGASRSIRDAFGELGLPVPDCAFSYQSIAGKKTAFVLFPGPGATQGTLENLCLNLVGEDPILSCVDTCLDCIKSKKQNLTSTHDSKRKISIYLAGQEDKDLIYTNPGQAAIGNAWNSEHPAMIPFKQILTTM
jgi:hypothetical protein